MLYQKVKAIKTAIHFFGLIKAPIFLLSRFTKIGLRQKHSFIYNYLLEYSPTEISQEYSLENNIESDCNIWIFWYQGFDCMPELVKSLYRNALNKRGRHKLVLLEKNNIDEYINLPDYIWNKVDKGIISLTHLSDIIRMYILSEYGGYWIDSTIFLSNEIPVYNTPFYSIKQKGFSVDHVSGEKNWTSFFIGTGKKNIMAKYVLEIFLNYWKTENMMISYLLIDYCIAIAYDHIAKLSDIILELPYDNKNVHKMASCLNDDFDFEKWNELVKSQTVFKLSYKIPLKRGDTIGQYIIRHY